MSLLHAQMELESRRQMKLFKTAQLGKEHPSHHDSTSQNPIGMDLPVTQSPVLTLSILHIFHLWEQGAIFVE